MEFGGLEACAPVLYATGTVGVQVGPASIAVQRAALASAAKAAVPDAARAATTPAGVVALPNPSAGQFRLRVTAATEGTAQLDVYDMQGRWVKAVLACARARCARWP